MFDNREEKNFSVCACCSGIIEKDDLLFTSGGEEFCSPNCISLGSERDLDFDQWLTEMRETAEGYQLALNCRS